MARWEEQFQRFGSRRRDTPSAPRPTPVNNTGGGVARAAPTGASTVAPGDSSDRGGEGFGGGSGRSGSSGFSIADILAAADRNEPHGYAQLGQYIDPKEIAIGAVTGQVPMLNTGLSVFGPITSTIWNQKEGPYYAGATKSPADVARNFAMSLPATQLMGLAQWYAGTPYAKAHPVGSYYMGGNADQQAAGAADAAYRSGGNANFMQSVYDNTVAQKNQGGAGYAGIGDDMASSLAAAINQGNADNYFLSPGGAALNAVNADIAKNDTSGAWGPNGHESYDGAALDMQNTMQASVDTGLAKGEVTQDLLDQLNAAGLTIDQNGRVANEAGGGDGGSLDGGGGGGQIDSGAESGFGWGTGYARGGVVRKPMPGAMNPPGPDDQVAPVQSGEGVLSRAAMRRVGPQNLKKLNSGASLADLIAGRRR